jgi:hypothetical protein
MLPKTDEICIRTMDREFKHYHLFIDLFIILTINYTMNRSLSNIKNCIIKKLLNLLK